MDNWTNHHTGEKLQDNEQSMLIFKKMSFFASLVVLTLGRNYVAQRNWAEVDIDRKFKAMTQNQLEQYFQKSDDAIIVVNHPIDKNTGELQDTFDIQLCN